MGQVRRTSFLVPVADLPKEDRLMVYRQAYARALAGAQANLDLRNFDYAVRDLNGNDLGLVGHGWAQRTTASRSTGNTFEDTDIDVRISEDRYIVVYGVYIASSVDSVASLRFEVGGSRTHQWDLQKALAEDPHRVDPEQRRLFVYPPPGEWVDLVEVPPNTQILVQRYVRGSGTVGVQPSEIVLLGLVAEKISGGAGALYGGN